MTELTTKTAIEQWLTEHVIGPTWHLKIADDLGISTDSHVKLCHNKCREIPVQFDYVGGDFICSYNQLTSLKGVPRHIKGGFHFNDNKISSLKGFPEHVGNSIDCANNQFLDIYNLIFYEQIADKTLIHFTLYRENPFFNIMSEFTSLETHNQPSWDFEVGFSELKKIYHTHEFHDRLQALPDRSAKPKKIKI